MSSVAKSTQIYSGFTPTSLGCTLWFDAADRNTITLSGSTVTQWNDKSGNNYHMVPRGVYGTSTVSSGYQNGLNVLNCSGNTIYDAPLGSAVYPIDCYVVIALKSPLTRCDVIAIAAPSPTDNFNSLTFGEHTPLRWHNGSSFFNRTPLTVSPSNETSASFLIMNWSIANNSFIIRRNGTQLSSTASYTFGLTANSRFQMGWRVSSSGVPDAQLNAYIGEIIAYPRQLATVERQQVEGYLAYKWALQSILPAGHPFISNLSTILSISSPLNITNCSLWLDAADANTLTLSGNNVSQWNDKSGNGRHASQATDSRRPVLTSNVINGLPAILWDGIDDNLTGSLPYPSTGQTTVFIVYNPTIINNEGRLFDINGNAYGNIGVHWTGAATPAPDILLWFGAGSTFADSKYTQAAASTGIKLISILFNGTSSLIFRDGILSTLSGNGNFATPNGTIYTLGNTSAQINAGMYTGYIAEVLFYSRNLYTSERIGVESYLANKWGLSITTTQFPYTQSIKPITRPFQPIDISGCSLWLDAADSSTLTLSGSTVTQWRDKSLNAFTGTAVASPTLVTNSINGLPVVQFDGTSQYINFGNVINLGTSAIYFFAVCQFDSTANGSVIAKSSARALIARWFLIRDASKAVVSIDPSGGGGVDAFFADTSLTPQLLMGSWNRTSVVSIFQNGTQKNTNSLINSSNLSNTDPLWIGAYPNSTASAPLAGYFLNGKVAEVLVFQSTLSDYDRQRIEGYLAKKWGLRSSLPSTQPFKSIFPLTVSFNPLQISGCSLWFDAADRTSLTLSGSTVTQWRDKSGNGNNTTAVSGTILFSQTGINPKGSLVFNNSYFTGPLSASSSVVYCFMVGSINSTTTQFSRILSLGRQGVSDTSQSSTCAPFIRNTGVAQIYSVARNVGTPPQNVTYGTPFLASSFFTGTSMSTSINGSAFQSSNVTTTFSINRYGIGKSTNTSDPSQYMGEICEIIYFGTTLTTFQIRQVEGYLARKWDLQGNLPTTHPYKKITP